MPPLALIISAIAFMPSRPSWPSKAPAPLIGTMAAIFTFGFSCAWARPVAASKAAPAAMRLRLSSIEGVPPGLRSDVALLFGGLGLLPQEALLQAVDLGEADEVDERIIRHHRPRQVLRRMVCGQRLQVLMQRLGG